MAEGPNIARIAALIGDPARAEMLTALMADRALTATELSTLAGVSKQTTSSHLAKLLDAKLVEVTAQGRNRYFRLANRDVARLLESLMGVAFRTGSVRLRSGPREPALRKARVCYDHLAGELAVLLYEALIARRVFRAGPEAFELTPAGVQWFEDFGVDVAAARAQRRTMCRPCLDWGERRNHLGGALGSALLQRFYALRWSRATRDSRVVSFTARGETELRRLFTA